MRTGSLLYARVVSARSVVSLLLPSTRPRSPYLAARRTPCPRISGDGAVEACTSALRRALHVSDTTPLPLPASLPRTVGPSPTLAASRRMRMRHRLRRCIAGSRRRRAVLRLPLITSGILLSADDPLHAIFPLLVLCGSPPVPALSDSSRPSCSSSPALVIPRDDARRLRITSEESSRVRSGDLERVGSCLEYAGASEGDSASAVPGRLFFACTGLWHLVFDASHILSGDTGIIHAAIPERPTVLPCALRLR
ncbi:hypothetical protein C8R44DRAFT_876542 [Mycena epipterygia]|nr:hypothetical protein C8R44DRAFT_876542 [Mycena epipterygia]